MWLFSFMSWHETKVWLWYFDKRVNSNKKNTDWIQGYYFAALHWETLVEFLFNDGLLHLVKVTHFSYSLNLLYKWISQCDGSVNIQSYIFVSAVSLFCIFEAVFFGFANKLIWSYICVTWLLFHNYINIKTWVKNMEPWAKIKPEMQSTSLWLTDIVCIVFSVTACQSSVNIFSLQRDLLPKHIQAVEWLLQAG